MQVYLVSLHVFTKESQPNICKSIDLPVSGCHMLLGTPDRTFTTPFFGMMSFPVFVVAPIILTFWSPWEGGLLRTLCDVVSLRQQRLVSSRSPSKSEEYLRSDVVFWFEAGDAHDHSLLPVRHRRYSALSAPKLITLTFFRTGNKHFLVWCGFACLGWGKLMLTLSFGFLKKFPVCSTRTKCQKLSSGLMLLTCLTTGNPILLGVRENTEKRVFRGTNTTQALSGHRRKLWISTEVAAPFFCRSTQHTCCCEFDCLATAVEGLQLDIARRLRTPSVVV